MARGLLSDHFRGVVFKTLSAVEADTLRSNQHEYNGTEPMKRIFGTGARKTFFTRFLLVSDFQEPLSEDGFLTWYDARERNPKRSEYRLYFPTNSVTSQARTGDAVFIATTPKDEVVTIVAPAGSTVMSQLLWLFDLQARDGTDFETRSLDEHPQETDYIARFILDELGISAEGPAEEKFDSLIEQFGLKFPPTKEFSAFARSTIPEADSRADPDAVLLAWIEREEQLFRRLERRIVEERLRAGFAETEHVDVDGFLGFSLSVQNRRKARAGSALENHLEILFSDHLLQFERGAETENRNRPDFLFPGTAAYRDLGFDAGRLVMLGSKTSCKDRWRQVLSEAQRIPEKHLLTLEPGISETQTEEMGAKFLQLVLPRALHATYKPSQQSALMTVAQFVDLVRSRQGA